MNPSDADQWNRLSLHVLAVVGDAERRQSLLTTLNRLGYSVEAADNADEGFAKAFGRAPDVALVELALTGSGGFEVARRLRALLGHYVLLVGLSAADSPEERQQACAAGFDTLLGPGDLEGLSHWLLVGVARAAWMSTPAGRRVPARRRSQRGQAGLRSGPQRCESG